MTKVVLITGGSRGIGRATALLAGARGWSVGVNFFCDAAAAARTLAEVEAAGGHGVAVRGDVSVEDDVIAMFDTVAAAFGGLDGFVDDAGVVAPSLPLADMSAARLKQMFDVDVYGAYLGAREAARRPSRDRGGRGGAIVNVSSAAARLGSPGGYVDDAGSKGALDTLTIGLAKELGPHGVRVNAGRPGIIDAASYVTGALLDVSTGR